MICDHHEDAIEVFFFWGVFEEVEANTNSWTNKRRKKNPAAFVILQILQINLETHVDKHAAEKDEICWDYVIPVVELVRHEYVL